MNPGSCSLLGRTINRLLDELELDSALDNWEEPILILILAVPITDEATNSPRGDLTALITLVIMSILGKRLALGVNLLLL